MAAAAMVTAGIPQPGVLQLITHTPTHTYKEWNRFDQLFSIVIFGCIANEGYINRQNEMEQYCIFNRNQNACNYGVFMGSMAFLCCIAFLALDVYFPQISSVKDRKKAVLADIGVSGGAVLLGLPEVQARGRLGALLAGIHRPKPGCRWSALHELRGRQYGESKWRRRPGQQ
ncbi:uncharacterized protein syngr1a isoform X5 [Oryzias melastigma]|uniref:uncharacterized protein syngr1a isoform X5 n=1 Tax=Oryzias melastigma TaxID=30732 RepID=UPI00168D3F99|nr:uncharacterized protein syngr1a isoform X5 [Oryzias melastigma]